jgi:polyhydroxybutyrate depolymerase
MNTRILALLTALTVLLSAASVCAQTATGLQRLEFTVDGVTREALIHRPAGTNPAPVVFVFHGHGGNMRQAARSFGIERHWPEAIVIYMQGLNTPGQLTDPEGKRPGWQAGPGQQGDRDLKFFDAVLARLKRDYQVDDRRIYATGHSNGGGFTYLLWAERDDVFAAMAPSAGVARYVNRLTPKPAFHLAGKQDALVKYSWQQNMMTAVRTLNGCAETGEPWAEVGTLYPSKNGTPLVTFIHPGGHQFPMNAPALMVKFFKEHPGDVVK